MNGGHTDSKKNSCVLTSPGRKGRVFFLIDGFFAFVFCGVDETPMERRTGSPSHENEEMKRRQAGRLSHRGEGDGETGWKPIPQE